MRPLSFACGVLGLVGVLTACEPATPAPRPTPTSVPAQTLVPTIPVKPTATPKPDIVIINQTDCTPAMARAGRVLLFYSLGCEPTRQLAMDFFADQAAVITVDGQVAAPLTGLNPNWDTPLDARGRDVAPHDYGVNGWGYDTWAEITLTAGRHQVAADWALPQTVIIDDTACRPPAVTAGVVQRLLFSYASQATREQALSFYGDHAAVIMVDGQAATPLAGPNPNWGTPLDARGRDVVPHDFGANGWGFDTWAQVKLAAGDHTVETDWAFADGSHVSRSCPLKAVANLMPTSAHRSCQLTVTAP